MKEIPEIGQFLRQTPGFEALSAAQAEACARSIEIAYYREGDDILTVGSTNRHLHIIRSGAVELRNEDGEMMTRLAEGDCFGFPSLMNDAPARNHSVAIEDTLGRKLDERDAVYTSTLYLLEGVGRDDAGRIAVELLANPVIETISVATKVNDEHKAVNAWR